MRPRLSCAVRTTPHIHEARWLRIRDMVRRLERIVQMQQGADRLRKGHTIDTKIALLNESIDREIAEMCLDAAYRHCTPRAS